MFLVILFATVVALVALATGAVWVVRWPRGDDGSFPAIPWLTMPRVVLSGSTIGAMIVLPSVPVLDSVPLRFVVLIVAPALVGVIIGFLARSRQNRRSGEAT